MLTIRCPGCAQHMMLVSSASELGQAGSNIPEPDTSTASVHGYREAMVGRTRSPRDPWTSHKPFKMHSFHGVPTEPWQMP